MITSLNQLSSIHPKGFLVLDGVNGAGKTTLLKKILQHLADNNKTVKATREPGATELGVNLRRLLLENPHEQPCSLAEMFLFAADRAEHVNKLIRPAINRGELVVSDRYYYSTVAFQGYGRKLDLEMTYSINQIAIDGMLPDLVLLLDLDPAEGLKRTTTRRTEDCGKDSFEREALEFHRAIREGFLEIARTAPEQFYLVDASKTPEQIWDEVKQIIDLLYLNDR
jgi:dTMP kinase